MSRIALSGAATGSATFTIESPATNTSRTLNLPDAAGTVVTDSATQTLTNKTLTSPTLTTPNINSAQVATVTGTAPIYMCRAWVNFDGTTGPGTIRGSGNVSSVTRNGTGDYTINFTTAMPDVNYDASADTSSNGTVNNSTNGVNIFANSAASQTAPTTSAFRMFVFHPGNQVGQNVAYITARVFR